MRRGDIKYLNVTVFWHFSSVFNKSLFFNEKKKAQGQISALCRINLKITLFDMENCK